MRFYLSDICGYGLSFQLDGFRIVFAALAVFMWTMSLVASIEYMKHDKHPGRYYFFTIVTLMATLGVFLSADFFTALIFFEIMSFTSYTWVAQTEKAAALRAADTYLAVAVIGGLSILMGLFLLYHMYGTLDFEELGRLVQGTHPTVMRYAAGVCILVGFGAKAGMFPLHIWLPKAHPVAPAPASALLSGMLTKCGIFGAIILASRLFAGDRAWGIMILVLGACTMFIGALLAVFSIDLKPALSEEQLDARLLRDFDKYKGKTLSNSLVDLLLHAFIPVILDKAGISGNIKTSDLKKSDRLKIVRTVKNFEFYPASLRGIEEAIVTSGGVDVIDVDPTTMESKLVKGLYFAGEVLDVDALTGGFNITVAMATGYVAGNAKEKE